MYTKNNFQYLRHCLLQPIACEMLIKPLVVWCSGEGRILENVKQVRDGLIFYCTTEQQLLMFQLSNRVRTYLFINFPNELTELTCPTSLLYSIISYDYGQWNDRHKKCLLHKKCLHQNKRKTSHHLCSCHTSTEHQEYHALWPCYPVTKISTALQGLSLIFEVDRNEQKVAREPSHYGIVNRIFCQAK